MDKSIQKYIRIKYPKQSVSYHKEADAMVNLCVQEKKHTLSIWDIVSFLYNDVDTKTKGVENFAN